MQKNVQRIRIKSHVIMLFLIIVITVMHYSRHNKDSMHSAKPVQRKGFVTSVSKDMVADGSPLAVFHLTMMN